VHLIVRGEGSEFVLGDISEDYQRMVDVRGATEARRWYRRQAAASAVQWLMRGRMRAADAWRRDVRYAARGLLRSPGYASAAVLTLGLALGGAAAVIAMAESILRPLPYPASDELVAVWETRDGNERAVAPANYLDWRGMSRAFEGLAAYGTRNASVAVQGAATRELVVDVSGNFFEVLGLEPALGRTFDPRLDPAFGERVLVLDHDTWVERFGADPGAAGRTVRIDDLTYEVVGVLAAGPAFPVEDVFGWVRSPTEAPELRGFPGDLTGLRDAWYFRVVGRLADGWGLAAARDEMSAVAARLAELHPETNRDAGVLLRPLLDETVGDFGRTLTAVALAVALVLLAAGVNVTHLTLARSAGRAGDVAVKVWLGAARADVRRQFVIEGVMLGLGGAALGLMLAHVALGVGVAELGPVLPRADEVALRARIVGAMLALGVVVGAVVAMLGCLRSHGPSGATGVRATAGATGATAATRTVTAARGTGGRVMIAAQVASAITLLAGTVLLGRSVHALARVDPGFAAEEVATLRVALPDARDRPYAERVEVYRALAEELARVAGVRAVGFGSDSPLGMGLRASVFLAGEARPEDPPDAGWQPVDTGFFGSLSVPVLRGRGLEASDDVTSIDVAVVNEAFTRAILPGRDPLGVRVTMGLDGHDRPLTIVGVVADTRTRGPAVPPGPVLYRPVDQSTRFGATSMLFTLRVQGGVPRVLADARAALRRVRPDLPVYAEATGAELTLPFRRTQSVLMGILGVFASCALLLGLVGVYGVASYGVRRRRREIGVRMALGADGRRVTAEVVADGMLPALLGTPVGLGLTLVLGRTLEAVLFDVPPSDPLTLAGAAVLVLIVTAAALFVPGRCAARIDPAIATRDG
jgi:predicted permease